MYELNPKIAAENFLQTLEANINNPKLSDKDFRIFVRNSLPIVEFKNKDGK